VPPGRRALKDLETDRAVTRELPKAASIPIKRLAKDARFLQFSQIIS
jgi:hypothetical protein